MKFRLEYTRLDDWLLSGSECTLHVIVSSHVPEKRAAEEHDSRVHDTVDSSFFPLMIDVHATFT